MKCGLNVFILDSRCVLVGTPSTWYLELGRVCKENCLVVFLISILLCSVLNRTYETACEHVNLYLWHASAPPYACPRA